MSRNVASNGRVNGGLSRVAKMDFERKVAELSTIPAGRKLLVHKIVDGKINGVPAGVVELAARKPNQSIRLYNGQLHIAAVGDRRGCLLRLVTSKLLLNSYGRRLSSPI